MKTKILTLFLLCWPILLGAQNYEQQGDELYQQAQYEKAIKKYNAATELNAAGSQVSQKIQNAQTCISLTNSAIRAENANAYSKAIDVYTRLYELNSIVLYKEKIADLKQKIKDVEQARIRREAEERERAEQERIEKERRYREEHPGVWKKNRISKIKRLTENDNFTYSQPYSNELMCELYFDLNKYGKWSTTDRTLALKLKIDQNFSTIITFNLNNGTFKEFEDIISKYDSLGTKVFSHPIEYPHSVTEEHIANDIKSYMDIMIRVRLANANKVWNELENERKRKNEIEKQKKEDFYSLIEYPIGNKQLNWHTPLSELIKALKTIYPDLTVKKKTIYGSIEKNRPSIRLLGDGDNTLTLSSIFIKNSADNANIKVAYWMYTSVNNAEKVAYDLTQLLRKQESFIWNYSTKVLAGNLNGVMINNLRIETGDSAIVIISFEVATAH